jgi:hypothetical protein
MREMDILRERLRNQHLVAPTATTPSEVVHRLGAVQAQDYGGARWAVAQRTHALAGADVDHALADGTILRTHLLRPTWHLVTPADIGWMLTLTAPRVKALMAYGNRESGLDGATLARSNKVLTRALRGGRQLTRLELGDVLERAGIVAPNAVGLGRLIVAAELDGVVCSGALRGRQHSYALLEERVTSPQGRDRPAALAELAGRYHTSHGPATIKDFAWWSGLSVADATAGVTSARPPLVATEAHGRTYWSGPAAAPAARSPSPTAHLLPNFDEYTVGYADRSLLIDTDQLPFLAPRAELIFNNIVTVDGRVVGTWKRAAQKRQVRVSLTVFEPLTTREESAVGHAADRYAAFLELPLQLEVLASPRRAPAPPAATPGR